MKIIRQTEDGRRVLSKEPMTYERCRDIAEWNGQLSAEQVRELLLSGGTIYTNFSKWTGVQE